MTEMERIVFEAMADFSEAETIGETRACVQRIETRLNAADALAEAAKELLEVFEDNEYIPDSFTFQPFRIALREYREVSNG